MDYTSLLDQFSTMSESAHGNEAHLSGSAHTASNERAPDDDTFPFASELWHETCPDTSQPFFSRKQSGMTQHNNTPVPHQGSLYRIEASPTVESPLSYRYAIEIALENGDTHELVFDPQHFDFMSRLFAILDTESRGLVGRAALMEFVTLRCPVFWRRDEDLSKLLQPVGDSSPTFDEVWTAVAECSRTPVKGRQTYELGVEGWMVFCRFVALAQYLEAKRQFSARHLQQTMRHRNSPRGSELVVVDVPPPASPAPLSPAQLADYERKGKTPLPLPELDLDHSLVAAHDAFRRRTVPYRYGGTVKISLFGTPGSTSSSSSTMEFAVTYSPTSSIEEGVVVRRSFDDMKWLNDTFASHMVLGGTLCGRILPPFPGSGGNALATSYQKDDSALKSVTPGGAMAAAAAGVTKIKGAAKSVLGRYVSSKSAPKPKSSKGDTKNNQKKAVTSLALPESYYNPNSPVWKARQLERFLNYLLEHPALSTSFPLNTVLKASQSGLEAAKRSLEDHAKTSKQLKSSLPQLVDGKLSIPFWSNQAGAQTQPNLSWVRTAAQAAMALKVHGILETTGLPSASARLQHASLPSFQNASSPSTEWAEEGNDAQQALDIRASPSGGSDPDDPNNFEHGVIHVDSELESEAGEFGSALSAEQDGYDLLPLPVPAPERRILCAGSPSSTNQRATDFDPSDPFAGLTMDETSRQTRFRYGSSSYVEQFESSDGGQVQSAFLGEFAVDNNIDKLREVIGSVENTLTRCLSASAGIGGARRDRLSLHLEVVKGFDSWQGMRGQFITQRALLRGVEGLEQSKDVSEESDLDIIDDIAWQTALAGSAVSAAEDVRSTVRAARTAASAKAAAESAAFAAQNACDAGNFQNIDEARAAQTRASIAQSHAIHAAVVEHEANTAKRRAALALAHDVKCWNVHRKREVLRTCLAYARSQHVASRRAVDAWSCLRDGFVGSSTVPFAETRPVRAQPEPPEPEEVTAVIFHESTATTSEDNAQSDARITAVEHDLLASPVFDGAVNELDTPDTNTVNELKKSAMNEVDAPIKQERTDGEHDGVPIVDAAPVSESAENEFGLPDDKVNETPHEQEEEDPLSASMQSLVDGLMNWGGQYSADDDFALPAGMAASIVMEESNAFGAHN